MSLFIATQWTETSFCVRMESRRFLSGGECLENKYQSDSPSCVPPMKTVVSCFCGYCGKKCVQTAELNVNTYRSLCQRHIAQINFKSPAWIHAMKSRLAKLVWVAKEPFTPIHTPSFSYNVHTWKVMCYFHYDLHYISQLNSDYHMIEYIGGISEYCSPVLLNWWVGTLT